MNEDSLSREEVEKFTTVNDIKNLAVNPKYCLWITSEQVAILRANGAIVGRKFISIFIFLYGR